MSFANDIRVITSPAFLEREAEKITRLLEHGVSYVHLRKPDAGDADVAGLLLEIPERYHQRIILHGNFGLFDKFHLGGVSLNLRNPDPPAGAFLKGHSCHSPQEAREYADMDFLLYSPVFPSISKPGYSAERDILSEARTIPSAHLVALGGVTPDRLKQLRDAGFSGAALLGYIWEGDFEDRLDILSSHIQKL